jgi:hypothetical protein
LLSALAGQKARQEEALNIMKMFDICLFEKDPVSIPKVAEKGAYPFENAACVIKRAGRIQPAGRSTPIAA